MGELGGGVVMVVPFGFCRGLFESFGGILSSWLKSSRFGSG